MNKILEILDKKQKEVIRTGSLTDWSVGYPESQWEILCRLENGHFFEDEKNLIFYTSQNEKFGFEENEKFHQDKTDFISQKTSEKILYWSSGSKITKSLVEKGVFEITDRVGHYIKVRVEPMIEEVVVNENNFKLVNLNGQQLALLAIALSKDLFHRPKKGQVYYESHNDSSCTLYFKSDYYGLLENSILMASYQGKFRQSNSEAEWNNLKEKIDNAEISNRDDIEKLQLYSIYD